MILLTAFKGECNSSKLLLDKVCDDNIVKKLLTNSFGSCEREIVQYICEYDPEYVISFGQKPHSDCLYIEPTACHNGVCIDTDFDVSNLQSSLNRSGIACTVSDKPTAYLCNHAYFFGLDLIQKSRLNTKMVFIHLPSVRQFQNIDSVARWVSNFCRNHS
ncbi:MAG: hypothetical protein UH824_07490 [Acutalibacteraceae bacterium]|nr:hypothetical protein [Acutalibacteraceae bacterium]